MLKLVLTCIVAITCIAPHALAQGKKPSSSKGRWELVGEQQVKRVSEYDDFNFKSSATYNAIKLRVKHSRVYFDKLVLVFDNGKSIEIPINKEIPEDGESRIIDLPTDRRTVKKIRFKYNTKGLFNDRAKVQVWGRR